LLLAQDSCFELFIIGVCFVQPERLPQAILVVGPAAGPVPVGSARFYEVTWGDQESHDLGLTQVALQFLIVKVVLINLKPT